MNKARSKFNEFLLWEAATRQTVDFKTIYVDMANDLAAGLMLSQIVYYYLPSKKDGCNKLRVFHDGHYWIAKSRGEWWDEIRLKPRQVDRALAILSRRGLVVTSTYKFSGTPMLHIRLDQGQFIAAWAAASCQGLDSTSPIGEVDFTDSSSPTSPIGEVDYTDLVQSITKTTAESDDNSPAAAQHPLPDSCDSVASESEVVPLPDDGLDEERAGAYWALRFVGVHADVARAEAVIRAPADVLAWAWVADDKSDCSVRPGLVVQKLRAGVPTPRVASASLAAFRQRVAAWRASEAAAHWQRQAAAAVARGVGVLDALLREPP